MSDGDIEVADSGSERVTAKIQNNFKTNVANRSLSNAEARYRRQ